MMLIVIAIALAVGIIVGSVGTGSKWSKAYDELTNKFKDSMEISSKLLGQVKDLKAKNRDLTNKCSDSMNQNLDLLEQNLDLSEKVRTLTKQLAKYRSKAKLYDKIWEQESEKTIETTYDVITKIGDEVDFLAPNNNPKYHLFNDKTTVNNGSYGYNTDDNGNIVEERILISPIVIFDEREKRHIDYFNNEFGLRLAYDTKTSIVLTLLHETGHMVDYHTRDDIKTYSNKNDELKAQLSECESQEEADYQYRQVPEERYADEFAVKMLVKYYPELAYAC